MIAAAFVVAIGMSISSRAGRASARWPGQQFPVLWTSVGLTSACRCWPSVIGAPLTFDMPAKSTFNLVGGFQVKPEFMSLYLALSFYTGAFIAEIVRAGILGVNKGQTEAYRALGLPPRVGLRMVIIPQAMRIVIPPLTSQYLNLTKNSSLAVAIAYPDLVSVGGTVLNQTPAIEIVLIWMVVYLGLSLTTSRS